MTSFFEQNVFSCLQFVEWSAAEQPAPSADCLYVCDVEHYKVTAATLAQKTSTQRPHRDVYGACVASAEAAEKAAPWARLLYLPMEVCRQSDVLEAAVKTKLPLVVERGVFLAPDDLQRLAEKLDGADFAFVECGSANGYSDRVLDPRSLYFMRTLTKYFGVSLSDLFGHNDTPYVHKAKWMIQTHFLEAFMTASQAFGSSFFVVKDTQIDVQSVLDWVNQNKNGKK